jgi:hypothetical protein
LTGAWKGGHAITNCVDLGAVTASTDTTLATSAGSTFTKGAWIQAGSGTVKDSNWISVQGQTFNSSGTSLLLDLGVGPNNTTVTTLVSNLIFTCAASWGCSFMFPLAIASGTSLWGRVSSNVINDPMRFHVNTFQDTFMSCASSSGIDTYGVSVTTNIGTAVDPGGTINTKPGTFTTIIASLTNDISGFFLNFDDQATTGTPGTGASWLIDVAVGASGSEQIILPNLYQIGFLGGTNYFIPYNHYIPIQIRAATRVSVRAQCTTATTPDRVFGVTIYGVRQ